MAEHDSTGGQEPADDKGTKQEPTGQEPGDQQEPSPPAEAPAKPAERTLDALPDWAAKEIRDLRAEQAARRNNQKTLEERVQGLETNLQASEQRRIDAERRSQLAGRVHDPEAALRLIRDEHVTNGELNVDAFLETYPWMRAQPEGKPGPAPTNAGGGRSSAESMDDYIRRKARGG